MTYKIGETMCVNREACNRAKVTVVTWSENSDLGGRWK